MTRASVPGKIILFGEHAVVYGRPAIAVPVRQVHVCAEITRLPNTAPGKVLIEAESIQLKKWLHELESNHPLRHTVQSTLKALQLDHVPPMHIQITSTIPIASGLGSGAAVSIAVLRALSLHLQHPLPINVQSELAFEIEKIHHGTPSGIDNTVIAYDQPLYFVSGQQHELLTLDSPLIFIVADSGERARTIDVVQSVREAWRLEKELYERIFDEVGQVTNDARQALEAGNRPTLGTLMDQNHRLLQQLAVSSPKLDRLTQAAREAGALGAKLSGAGRGGNVICLAEEKTKDDILDAMNDAGSAWTLATEIEA